MSKENEKANISPKLEEDIKVKEERARVDALKENLTKLTEAFAPFRGSPDFYSYEITLQGSFDRVIVKAAAELEFKTSLTGTTGFIKLEKAGIKITLT